MRQKGGGGVDGAISGTPTQSKVREGNHGKGGMGGGRNLETKTFRGRSSNRCCGKKISKAIREKKKEKKGKEEKTRRHRLLFKGKNQTIWAENDAPGARGGRDLKRERGGETRVLSKKPRGKKNWNSGTGRDTGDK